MDRCLKMLFAAALAIAAPWAAAHCADHDAPSASPARWVVAPSKPQGSGIVFSYDVPARLKAGEAAVVRLRFRGATADDAQVRLSVPDEVTLAAGAGSAMLLPGRETTLELSVVPRVDGVHYLDVFTLQGGRRSAHSVPLRTGSAQPTSKSVGTVTTTPFGEKVISLPSR